MSVYASVFRLRRIWRNKGIKVRGAQGGGGASPTLRGDLFLVEGFDDGVEGEVVADEEVGGGAFVFGDVDFTAAFGAGAFAAGVALGDFQQGLAVGALEAGDQGDGFLAVEQRESAAADVAFTDGIRETFLFVDRR